MILKFLNDVLKLFLYINLCIICLKLVSKFLCEIMIFLGCLVELEVYCRNVILLGFGL